MREAELLSLLAEPIYDASWTQNIIASSQSFNLKSIQHPQLLARGPPQKCHSISIFDARLYLSPSTIHSHQTAYTKPITTVTQRHGRHKRSGISQPARTSAEFSSTDPPTEIQLRSIIARTCNSRINALLRPYRPSTATESRCYPG